MNMQKLKSCLILPWILLAGAVVAAADEQYLLMTPIPVTTSSAPSIFPGSWQRPPVAATGKALDEIHFDRTKSVLTRALAKYPEAVLREHLKQVFVLSELQYSGVRTSGTNSAKSVYLRVGTIQDGFTDEWIERVFHAEFSSILLRNCGIDSDSWQSFNPPEFKYLGSGVTAIKLGKHGLRLDERLHVQGFLKQYSQSTLENDFNAFAASLFVGDKRLWELSEIHPNLKGKRDLTIAFYHTLDPTWTETKFQAFTTP